MVAERIPAQMASKKDKLIEEAQRLALRGQLDKAIKLYAQVVALDPAAINLRQRLAELLLKSGRAEEARVEFETIGKHYSSHGFYLKAIAVYKKLQMLFPEDVSITLNLAGLNQKNGLLANALAEYKRVYDYYEKHSETEEALNILDKMQRADMQNVGIKLKLAEAYFDAGKTKESYSVFGSLAALLQERRDIAAFQKIAARIQQLFPEKTDFTFEVLSEQVSGGNVASAVNGLQALLKSNPRDKRLWVLIIEAYRKLGQPEWVRISCQHFLRFFPEDTTARIWMVACLVEARDIQGALSLLDQYEQSLLTGSAAELMEAYRSLERLDPINLRILEGYKRACEGAGNQTGAEELNHKIASLHSVSRGLSPELPAECPLHEQQETVEPSAFIEAIREDDHADLVEFQPLETALQQPEPDLSFSESLGIFAEPEDEIEIEIDVDDEFESEVVAEEGEPGENVEDAWLDSVGEIFDAIAATPRSVKFGNDLETTDVQSHYDLGVAFREMGLYDEAINEFHHAAGAADRRVECLVLQGACLRDKGDLTTSETLLRSLLKPGLSAEDSCSVKYELALTCERAGRSEEAARFLAEIDASCPEFRDVRSRLSAAGMETSIDFSDEELQDFELK